MNRLTFTLKAWPVVASATIGLCFLTKTVAGWLGVDLPDQQNVEVMRRYLTHAFDSPKLFATAAFLVAQVVALLPALEEVVFRWLLCRLPQRLVERRRDMTRGTREARETRESHLSPLTSQPLNLSTSQPLTSHFSLFTSHFSLLTSHFSLPTSHSLIRLFAHSLIFFSSALFAAAHYLAQPWPDAAFLALFFFGAAQCWLYRRTDRLWCAIVNHALFNLTNLVLLFVLPAESAS